MKILVVDDHVLIREALRGVLKEIKDDAVVLEASDWQQATQLIEERPDLNLILLDLMLPDGRGLGMLADLRERYPAISIVVMSALQDRDNVIRALDLGALGFIPKSAQRAVMLSALQLILSGGVYVPPEILASGPPIEGSPERAAAGRSSLADPTVAADGFGRPHGNERRLATILSADVAEYSRLLAEDEEENLRTFWGHKQVFESLVAMRRGRIFNTAGDAILVEFNSPVEALRCAIEIQAALQARNDQLSPSRQVNFRIGVNLGDVMLQGTDLLGDAVNVAARLQAGAAPGGVWISGSVYDQVHNKLPLFFKPLGQQRYKNIPQPVRTYSVALAEGGGALPSSSNTRHSRGRVLARWLIGIATLLLLLGGGLWVYFQSQ